MVRGSASFELRSSKAAYDLAYCTDQTLYSQGSKCACGQIDRECEQRDIEDE